MRKLALESNHESWHFLNRGIGRIIVFRHEQALILYLF